MSGFGLPRDYRFQLKNEVGVSVDWTLQARRAKLDSNGALSFEGTETQIGSATGVTDGSVSNGTAQDNSTAQWLGGEFELSVTASTGTPSGDAILYFQVATDGSATPTWPEDESGFIPEVINFTATGTKTHTFEL